MQVRRPDKEFGRRKKEGRVVLEGRKRKEAEGRHQ